MKNEIKVIKYNFEDAVLFLKGQGRAYEANPSGMNDFIVAVPYIKMLWRTGSIVILTVDGISLTQPLQFNEEASAIIFHDRFADELMDFYANEAAFEGPEGPEVPEGPEGDEPPSQAGRLN